MKVWSRNRRSSIASLCLVTPAIQRFFILLKNFYLFGQFRTFSILANKCQVDFGRFWVTHFGLILEKSTMKKWKNKFPDFLLTILGTLVFSRADWRNGQDINLASNAMLALLNTLYYKYTLKVTSFLHYIQVVFYYWTNQKTSRKSIKNTRKIQINQKTVKYLKI